MFYEEIVGTKCDLWGEREGAKVFNTGVRSDVEEGVVRWGDNQEQRCQIKALTACEGPSCVSSESPERRSISASILCPDTQVNCV